MTGTMITPQLSHTKPYIFMNMYVLNCHGVE